MNQKTIPYAYFITFRTYGSWLPGDERTYVDRSHNCYNTPRLAGNRKLHNVMQTNIKNENIILTEEAGTIVLNAALTLCQKSDWRLFALHVRSNHVHVTLRAKQSPELVMTQLKAYATRFLRKEGVFHRSKKIWARHGSTKYVWHAEDLYFANEYVIEKQGKKRACHFDDTRLVYTQDD